MLRKLRNDKGGFTLIELMIVIAIIGILAAIAIPNFLAYKTKGQDQAAVSSLKNFYHVAMAYFADPDLTGSQVGWADLSASNGLNLDPNVTISNGKLVEKSDGSVSTTATITAYHNNASTRLHTLKVDGSISSP